MWEGVAHYPARQREITMTDLSSIYTVYMDNNVILGTFTLEERAYALVRTEAKIHRESEFMIQKTETVFDSIGEPRDKLSLHMIRNPRRTNAIHASIHEADWKIGWEDAG
jgi:hypothetical protein